MGSHLKNLCCGHGWSYAVVWRFKSHDSMLLIPVDAYHELESGVVLDQVLHQVHLVGEGIIGQVALTGRHRWIFSDTYCGELNAVGLIDNQAVFQDTAQWNLQFSAGVKTIAVISVSSQSVVQFGSNKKIPESLEFVDHIIRSFYQLPSLLGTSLYENPEKSIGHETYDAYGIFGSLPSSGIAHPNYSKANPLHDSYKELIAKAQVSKDFVHCFTSEQCHSGLTPHSLAATPVVSSSSSKQITSINNSCLKNYPQTADVDSQVILSTTNLREQGSLQASSSSANNSVFCCSSIGTWGGELLSTEFFRQQLLSGIREQGDSKMFPSDSQKSSFSSSLDKENGLPQNIMKNASATIEHTERANFPFFHNAQGKLSSSSESLTSELKENYSGLELLSLNSVNYLNQSSALALERAGLEIDVLPSNDLLQMIPSLTSRPVGENASNNVPANDSCNSVQNSVVCITNSSIKVSDEKQKPVSIPTQPPCGNGLADGLGFDNRQHEGWKSWESTIFPRGSDDCSNFGTGIFESISTLDAGSLTGCEKGFFSNHGLEQLLDAVVGNANSLSNPNSSDQSSTTILTRAGSSYMHSNKIPLVGQPCLTGVTHASLSKCPSAYGPQKEMLTKSLVSQWIESSNNVSAESSVISQTKKPEDSSKVTRKRARPGESTRPRPKDRQQIQDRVKELREIVPHGAKCSIDALLDRTIKHMLFLQSVTKYADKLKQANEPKMIGEGGGVLLKDNSTGNGGGATWAFEVGGQTMVCPIVVEDLNPLGQMLIEMLCEEHGFFLEIADIIRRFGLTILKGVMEVRDDKVWARFIVEANRDVTRMDIFMSLVQLLQETAATTTSSGNQSNEVVDSTIPAFTNNQEIPMPQPISLPDRLL